MQPESSRYEEEPPSLFWGLDPVFLAFAKLYIRDILDLKESCQVPGIFFYKGHPIRQVDILGTVVGVRERETFYVYGVDDSTGVINCICWKKLASSESSSAVAAPSARELSLTAQLMKLQETIKQRAKLEIGDVLRVRGCVQIYRGEREIRAMVYYKVDDPMYETQIARMRELPSLYRQVYDQPFRSAALEKEKALSSNPRSLDLLGLTSLLSEKAREFLLENRVQTFYQQELEMEPSLLSLANQPVIHSTCSEQATIASKQLQLPSCLLTARLTFQFNHLEEAPCLPDLLRLLWTLKLKDNHSLPGDQLFCSWILVGSWKDAHRPGTTVDLKKETTAKAIHSIFKDAVDLLQEKGVVFQKESGFDHMYYVTREDKELHRVIHRIIQEDCQKSNHMEKGCHFRHILACARLRLYPGLREAVLQQVLDLLEDQSDIISATDNHYVAF